jgi:hypothetical protein
VCRAIELPVDSFFHAVFPRRKEVKDDSMRVERGLLELHPAPYATRMPAAATPGPGTGPWAKADRLMERLRQVLVDIEQNGV